MAQLPFKLELGVGDANYQKTSIGYYFGTPFVDRVETAVGGRCGNPNTFFFDCFRCRGAEIFLKTIGSRLPKNFSLTRMEVKVNFEDYSGAAKVEWHKVTEPNQALQRMNVLVTDYAPSSILRAKHVHR